VGDYYYPGYLHDAERARQSRAKFFEKLKGLFKKKSKPGKNKAKNK
jgi:hypothetical protein